MHTCKVSIAAPQRVTGPSLSGFQDLHCTACKTCLVHYSVLALVHRSTDCASHCRCGQSHLNTTHSTTVPTHLPIFSSYSQLPEKEISLLEERIKRSGKKFLPAAPPAIEQGSSSPTHSSSSASSSYDIAVDPRMLTLTRPR